MLVAAHGPTVQAGGSATEAGDAARQACAIRATIFLMDASPTAAADTQGGYGMFIDSNEQKELDQES